MIFLFGFIYYRFYLVCRIRQQPGIDEDWDIHEDQYRLQSGWATGPVEIAVDSFVLYNPPGPLLLPSQPDASNYYENCPGSVQEYMGPFVNIAGEQIARPLLCHRVDACVGGCVVLSKDTNGQKVFQEFQRERKLRKIYKAVTRTSVPLGMHLHWMWAPQNARGKSGGPPCQLVSHTPPESRRKARVRKIIRFFGCSLLLLKLHTLSVELCSCSW